MQRVHRVAGQRVGRAVQAHMAQGAQALGAGAGQVRAIGGGRVLQGVRGTKSGILDVRPDGGLGSTTNQRGVVVL